jgi:hypothetical protein
MPRSAKFYIFGVIAVGTALLAGSLVRWAPQPLSSWLLYLALTMLASSLKVRLPGLTRTYSLSFLFLLFGVGRYSLAEVLIAGCAGALVQSVCNAKKRPTLVQVLFNMANLAISTGVCFAVARVALVSSPQFYRPAATALVAFVFFLVNTVLVSGVLALLEGKPLSALSNDYYIWSFPYYLIGASLVGLIPSSLRAIPGEGWLILLPLLYLVHFFVGLVKSRPASEKVSRDENLPGTAKAYVFGVIGAGLILFGWAGIEWFSQDVMRFAGFLLLTVVASMFKVRLPGLRGTISVNFVLILVSIAQLSLSEAIFLSAIAGMVQCVWKAKRTPTVTRTLFNAACLALSTAAAFLICRGALAVWTSGSLVGLLVAVTLVFYSVNNFMVATVLCLVEHKPVRTILQGCYFWSCPYHLVGTAAAGIMIETCRVAGWQPSLLVLPVMGLVHLSYRLHIWRNDSAVWGS